jgi:hypothetical protein
MQMENGKTTPTYYYYGGWMSVSLNYPDDGTYHSVWALCG